jgi:hypothetical protein
MNFNDLTNQTAGRGQAKNGIMTNTMDTLPSYETLRLSDSYDRLHVGYDNLTPADKKAFRRIIRNNANDLSLIEACTETTQNGKEVTIKKIFEAFQAGKLKATKISDNVHIVTGFVKSGVYCAFRLNVMELKNKLQTVKQVQDIPTPQDVKPQEEKPAEAPQTEHQAQATQDTKPADKTKSNRK